MEVNKILNSNKKKLADIGGFFKDPEKEMFIRWNQLAILNPFMRNHAHLDSKYREPWKFDEQTLEIVRNTIRKRYTYLPYLYLCFYESNTYGYPIMRYYILKNKI